VLTLAVSPVPHTGFRDSGCEEDCAHAIAVMLSNRMAFPKRAPWFLKNLRMPIDPDAVFTLHLTQ